MEYVSVIISGAVAAVIATLYLFLVKSVLRREADDHRKRFTAEIKGELSAALIGMKAACVRKSDEAVELGKVISHYERLIDQQNDSFLKILEGQKQISILQSQAEVVFPEPEEQPKEVKATHNSTL